MRSLLALAAACFLAVPAGAAQITSIVTTTDDLSDTSGNYTATGAPTSSFSTSTTYTLNFHVGGAPDNRYLQSVTAGGTTFNPLPTSPTLGLVRVNNTGVTGSRQLLWYAGSQSGTTFNLDPTRATSMSQALLGRNVARGTDNVFENTSSNNKNNIERIDYIYSSGLRPNTTGQLAFGFTILERGANDSFKAAAITGLDSNGAPSAYGNLLSFTSSSWGANLQATNTVVVRSDSGTNFQPSAFVSGQSLGGIFMSLSDLGISVNQKFYGYSLFGGDVTTTSHTLTNAATFPTNTTGTPGGLDLVAGGLVFNPAGSDPEGFVVPEPGSVLLLGAGLLSVLLLHRRRQAKGARA